MDLDTEQVLRVAEAAGETMEVGLCVLSDVYLPKKNLKLYSRMNMKKMLEKMPEKVFQVAVVLVNVVITADK